MSSGIDVPAQVAVAILVAAGVMPEAADAPQSRHPVAQVRPHSTRALSDERWLHHLYHHGDAAAVPLARRIFKTGSGRLYVPAAQDRHEIAVLKQNPAVVARVLALVAKANAQDLEQQLGRPATMSEMFAAHQLGVTAAAELIAAAAQDPRRPSIEVLPAQALAYPELFFERTRPRSSAGVLEILSAAFEKVVQSEIGHRRAVAERGERPRTARSAVQVSSTVIRRW